MAASPELIVTWSPTLADAHASLRLGFWGTPGRVVRSVFLLFVLPALLFGWLINVGMGLRLSGAQLIAISVVAALAWGGLFGLAFGAWLARFMLKSQRAQGDPQKILLWPDAIERVLKDSKITHPWSAISSIEETRPAFILHGAAGPVTSIEKSGIPSIVELEALRTYLRTKKPGKYLSDEST